MKTLADKKKSKSGGILILAMGIMLFLAVLTIGLYQLQTTNAVEAVRWDHSKQAFWQAETGLRDAVQRLAYNVDNLRVNAQGSSAFFSTTNAAAGTGYKVQVTDTLNGNPLIDQYIYSVEAVGYVHGRNRVIQLSVTNMPGITTAIMAPVNINVDQNTLVDGPIMVLDNGMLTIDDKIPPGQSLEEDFDIIILDLDAGASVDPGSGAIEGEHYDVVDLPVPDNFPVMPDFSAYAPTNTVAASTNLGVVNLSGLTTYNYDGGITVSKITGSGILVNSGDIAVNGSTVTGDDVSPDVAILSFGSVSIGKKTDFMGDTLIYGFNQVVFRDGSFASARSAILADGGTFGGGTAENVNDIIMGGQSEFEGLVFADEGSIKIEQGSGGANNTRIVGTVIAGHSVDMNQNAEIIFDPEALYDGGLFDLNQVFQTDVVTSVGNWKELPPEL